MKNKFPNKFPSISRFITDKEHLLIITSSLIILIALIIVGFNTYEKYVSLRLLKVDRAEIVSEEGFWRNIVLKYPDFRDAYLALAVVEYKLGNREGSLENVEKALKIDPNYTDAYKFRGIIKKN